LPHHGGTAFKELPMRIVITGGAGFLGTRLARAILARERLIDARGAARRIREIVLLDVAPAPDFGDPRVRSIAGDLADPAVIEHALTPDTDTVFHLAAVVSGQAEAEFDVGMRVNLDATRALLERCRHLAAPPKFVFTSSLAVFGGPLPDPVPDDAPLTPQASYGTQKAIGEYLVYDMTRKGFLDGRSVRLPTVTVRPGKPNKAASSFASGIIREPLSGVDAVCPVAATTRMWVISPRAVIANLVIGHEVPAAAFAHTRSVNMPGMSIAVGDMVAALRRVAGEAVAARVKWQLDPAIDRIVSTWPSNFAPVLGPSLGMQADPDFESIVRAYIADDLPRNSPFPEEQRQILPAFLRGRKDH
jgi:nucleoside-diphosphate-sugar epimerase